MMEMVDTPMHGKKEQRISFSDIYNNNRNVESSGVTLGLILKEYCEFKVSNYYIELVFNNNNDNNKNRD